MLGFARAGANAVLFFLSRKFAIREFANSQFANSRANKKPLPPFPGSLSLIHK